MHVRFWGVRGSFPVPGPKTNRYGGNTACVQVHPDDGSALIIDAGTGIRKLGQELMAAGADQTTVHLLISHTHWDHIQGIPFFAPLYTPGNRINIYARQRDVHLRTIFSSQTEDPYFPVSLNEVAADVTYTALVEGQELVVGDTRIRCARLNHPYIALGYRLDGDGGSVAYVSDTAPFDRILFGHQYIAGGPDLDGPLPEEDRVKLEAMRQGVVDLCRDCDLVIYDTMFRLPEYMARPHWGHSSPEHALDVVHEAGARCLALFHHAPGRSDEEVAHDLAAAREAAGADGCDVLAAREGMVLELGDGAREVA
jgi:phosphoribosyl 1,2-cyclic phosphodiesterase